jgi:hypothetical protein
MIAYEELVAALDRYVARQRGDVAPDELGTTETQDFAGYEVQSAVGDEAVPRADPSGEVDLGDVIADEEL